MEDVQRSATSSVDSTFVRGAILHAIERWHWPPLAKPNLHHLQRDDRAMIRQICNVRPEYVATSRSNELLELLSKEDLDLILRERMFRWYGHMERLSRGIKTAWDMYVSGSPGAGRPKTTWKEVTERDQKDWKLTKLNLMTKTFGKKPCV